MSLYARLSPVITVVTSVVADVGVLLARITIGQAFALTGLGKLKNLDRTTSFFESLGIPAPGLHAMAIGGLELVGGCLLIIGLITRPIATLLAATMAVAILTADRADFLGALAIHPDKGLTDVTPWMFGLFLLWFISHGAGRLSIDQIIRWKCASNDKAKEKSKS